MIPNICYDVSDLVCWLFEHTYMHGEIMVNVDWKYHYMHKGVSSMIHLSISKYGNVASQLEGPFRASRNLTNPPDGTAHQIIWPLGVFFGQFWPLAGQLVCWARSRSNFGSPWGPFMILADNNIGWTYILSRVSAYTWGLQQTALAATRHGARDPFSVHRWKRNEPHTRFAFFTKAGWAWHVTIYIGFTSTIIIY